MPPRRAVYDPAAVERALTATFRRIGTRKRAEGEKKYLKSALDFFGVPMPEIREAAKRVARAHPAATHEEILRVAEHLFASRWHEHRSAGIALLELDRARITSRDIPRIERLLRRAGGWAHLDWLAANVLGDWAARESKARLKKTLGRWAKDEDFWIRRAALLAQLEPLRRGGGDFALFAALATPMLEEKEVFIRKAIGWVLREVSKKRPEPVFELLLENLERVSGLTRREGAKYLSAQQRRALDVGSRRSAGR